MSQERHIDPDYAEDELDRLTRMVATLVAREVQSKSVEVSYQEGINERLLKWLLGLVALLLVAAITGGIVTYGTVQELRAQVEAQQRQLDRIEDRLKPTYRGGSADSP